MSAVGSEHQLHLLFALPFFFTPIFWKFNRKDVCGECGLVKRGADLRFGRTKMPSKKAICTDEVGALYARRDYVDTLKEFFGDSIRICQYTEEIFRIYPENHLSIEFEKYFIFEEYCRECGRYGCILLDPDKCIPTTSNIANTGIFSLPLETGRIGHHSKKILCSSAAIEFFANINKDLYSDFKYEFC